MKISELMERLGELQANHGDIEVVLYDEEYMQQYCISDIVLATDDSPAKFDIATGRYLDPNLVVELK